MPRVCTESVLVCSDLVLWHPVITEGLIELMNISYPCSRLRMEYNFKSTSTAN